MSDLSLLQIQALAAAAAETAVDMTVVTKSSGRLLPAGKSLGRLVQYIEFGSQPQSFTDKGVTQVKPDADEMRLGFELYGANYLNDDGTPYVISTFDTAISTNAKAGAFKLFKLLNWKGLHKNWVGMVGELFIVDIVNVMTQGATPTKVHRINMAGFLPPLDPLSQAPYDAPAMHEPNLKLFLFDKPNMQCWNSVFADGKFDNGDSKNFIQEKILSAKNFAGSPVEAMLMTNGVSCVVPERKKKAGATPVAGTAAAGVQGAMPDASVAYELRPVDTAAPFDGGVPVGTGSTAVAAMPDMPGAM